MGGLVLFGLVGDSGNGDGGECCGLFNFLCNLFGGNG